MKELWEQATQTYNLPLTIGMIIFSVYWIISSIGLFDFDTDVDIDLDLDAEADINVDGGIFSSILHFVNATDVPLMLILTLINTLMWGIAMATNHVINPENHQWLALALFIANFIVSVVITRYISKPLAPLFKSLQDDVEKALPLVGQVGKVKSRVLDHHYGQVEIPRDKDSPALINVKLSDTDSPLVRGDEVLVVKFDKDSQRYIVRSLTNQSIIQSQTNPNNNSHDNDQETDQSEPTNLTTNN